LSTTVTPKKQHISPRVVLNHIRSESRNIILKVGALKLKEQKMVPISFTFAFDTSSSEPASKKSLIKFAEIIRRHFSKQCSFHEYLTLVDPNKLGISIPVHRPDIKSDSTLKRYVSLINYKCRLYGVPGFLTIKEAGTEAISVMCRAKEIMDPKDKSTPKINVITLNWGVIRLRQGVSGNTVEEYLSRKEYWATESLTIFGREVRSEGMPSDVLNNPILDKLITPERIFFFLPEIIQTLITLSRKGIYDYRAFSIRPE
jgi:hypothetical protein